MISSSAVSNFAWTLATPPSGPTGLTAAELNASADSFQNIFANAAALPQFATVSPALSNASSLGSNRAANWTTQANDDPETASDDDAAAPTSDSYDNEPANATDSNSPLSASQSSSPVVTCSASAPNSSTEPAGEQSTNSAPNSPPNSAESASAARCGNSVSAKATNQAAARNSPASTKPVSTKVDKKANQANQAQQAGTNGTALSGVSGGSAAARAVPLPEALASARAAAQAAADRRSDVQQTASITDPTTQTASPGNALPASANPLAGAAFALHITPANNHNDAIAKTSSPVGTAAGAVQAPAASPATATPADNTLTDPSVIAVGVGITDPAGLKLNATLPANAGIGISRQVSALGPSLGSADAPPWSGQTSSPALLDDKAEPTESVAAPAPIAEIDMDDPTRAAQPVRTLQLQLGGTGDQRVDLRLVEHAGGLSVSVRASDSSLTRGLQDNLPELSSRLAAEHYQTQTWLPAAGQTSAGGHSSGSFEQSPDQRGGRQSSQDGSSSGGQGNSPQGREQDQPPAWLRQLAALGGGPSLSTSVPGSLPNAASPIIKQ